MNVQEDKPEIEVVLEYCDMYPHSGQNKQAAIEIRKLQADNLRLTNGCNELHRKLGNAKRIFHISDSLLNKS